MSQRSISFFLICTALGCSDGGHTTQETTRHFLRNTDAGYLIEVMRQVHKSDGTMEGPEEPGDDDCMIVPDPGECPFLEYREEHTVVVDSEGNIVSETYSFCTRCFDEEGNTVGEETCVEEPLLPPEVACYEYEDETSWCYECVDADGTVADAACYPKEDPGPGEDCFALLCERQPSCCEESWDESCDALLGEVCPAPEPPCDEPPVEEPPVEEPPSGDDCVARFCEAAPTCCELEWDESCDAVFADACGEGGTDDPREP